ncbi:hypothetical protein FSP39_009432 [Pinctada imbricata]|uniref:Uncharacterized protein n=1 Tax=Pinctada imbricata TaxID=66713 RepID=A0AA88XZJ5_PINIB|nr:hypothetical protein FSP39_009432 [Pinctada imbricata]
MDCLHGILMHGDSDQGDTHKNEDNYLRFKPHLEAGKPKTQAGPQDADETFHDALMHGDGDGHHDDKEMLPQKPAEKFGPDDADTMLHGVLMHGDGEAGHDHGREDAKLKETGVRGKAEPLDAEGMMHGMLMHGDADSKPHDHHGDESKEENSGAKGPADINDMMHKFMHKDGDTEHHEHAAADDKTHENSGPTDQEALMHGLMHGEEGTDHKHEEKKKPFKFDVDEILKLGLPDELLKKIGLDKLKKKDEEDYKKWQKESKDDDNSWGSTFAYISDSILQDIEIMKRRYLARDEKTEKEINDYVNSKNGDFSAKDVEGNLDLEGQDHDGDDTTHDLELIGSTEPINARHKTHIASERAKKKA